MSDPQVAETKQEVKPEEPKKEAPKVETKKAAPKKEAKKVKPPPKKVAAKEPKKAAKKEKKEAVKIKYAQVLKRGPGPAMVKLANKLKKDPVMGQCDVKGCNAKAVNARSWRCLKHKKAIRKMQLKANNGTWRKRVKNGEAGHHVVYDGRATVFTLQNRSAAEKIIAAGRATVTTKTELEKAIRAVPLAVKKEIKKAS